MSEYGEPVLYKAIQFVVLARKLRDVTANSPAEAKAVARTEAPPETAHGPWPEGWELLDGGIAVQGPDDEEKDT